MKIFQSVIMLCLSAVLFSSCATQNIVTLQNNDSKALQAQTSVFNYDPNYEYTLQKDDKVSISIWDNDDLSVGSVYGIYNSNEVYGKWLMLDAAGNVTIPKLGEINLMGLTVPQAKEKLAIGFKKWIVNPIIEVRY